ncbi:MAG: LlsX family protein, partial [Oscillospiraceae bacterium]
MKTKRKKLKTPLRIAIFLVIGFALAMLFMTIAIYFGYNNAYNNSVDNYSVNLFGMGIYTLTKAGAEYVGTSIGTN